MECSELLQVLAAVSPGSSRARSRSQLRPLRTWPSRQKESLHVAQIQPAGPKYKVALYRLSTYKSAYTYMYIYMYTEIFT